MRKIVLFLLIVHFNCFRAQNFFWAKNIGDRPLTAATNTSGDIYTAGYFQGVVDFDPGAGTYTLGVPATSNNNLFVSKSSAAGNFITAYGALVISGSGSASAYSIKTDVTGNVYLTGRYYTAPGGVIDFDPGPGSYTISSLSAQGVCFVLKLDANGNLLWFKSLEGSGGTSTGVSISVDGSGNVFTAGHYNGSTDFDPGIGTYSLSTFSTPYNSFVLKLDAAGNFVFAKEVSGNANVLLNEMALDALGNMLFTGAYLGTADFDPGTGTYTLTSAGGEDIFVFKLDPSGNFIWAKSMGGAGNNYARSIAVDQLGNSHLTGASSGTADYDPGPGTFTLTSAAAADIFILKLDASGNFVWVKTMGNSTGALQLTSVGNSIDVDAWGNVYSTGSIGAVAPVDFDPGPGTHLLSVNSASACNYISELDASGNFIWAGVMGGGAGKTIRVNTSGVYLAGYYYGIQDIDPTFGTYSLTNAYSDGYILKLSGAPSISGPPMLCTTNSSASATYSVAHASGNTYTWTVSSGAVINSGANTWSANITLPSGPSTIAISITQSLSTTTRSVVVNLGIPPTVSITASPSLSVCIGSSLTLNATGASTIFWSGGVSNNVPFQPAASSNYVATGISSNGCVANSIATVSVFPLPIVFYSVAPAYSVCTGYTLSFTQMGLGVDTYTFSGGILNNVPYVLNSSTIVTITGTGPGGCINSFSLTIGAIPGPTLGILATPSPTMCAGTILTLSGTGASTTYSWSGGISNNVPFTPLTSAVYTVSALGINNCIGRATVSVVVHPNPNVTINSLPSTFICAGSTLVLSGAGASSYSWTGGVPNNVPFTPLSNTVFIVTGTSTNGCVNSATVPINILSLPVVSAQVFPAAIVCAGSTVNFTGSGASVYGWSGGVLNNVPFVATSTGVYTVTGTNNSGCVNTAIISLTVNPLPVLGVVVLPSASVCVGSTISLGGTGAATYSWSGGIFNTTPLTAITSTLYTLTGVDTNGCSDTLNVYTTVYPLPNLSFVALPSLSICAGSPINLTGNGASTYTWSNGVNNAVSFVPANTGSYSLQGTNTNGCTNTLSLTVVVNPQPSITIQALSQTIAVGNGAEFVVASSNSTSVFQWQQNTGSGFVNVTNGGPYSGVNTATLQLTNANLLQNGYSFRCLLNEGDCADTSGVAFLTVYDATGIFEMGINQRFTLLPNPATESCRLFLDESGIGLTYSVSDQTGRCILLGTIETIPTVLNIQSLASGLYLVSVNNRKPVKLIKQ